MKNIKTSNILGPSLLWIVIGILPLFLFYYYTKVPTTFSFPSNFQLHISTEIWASIIAILTGTIVFIHFFATGRNFFMIISLGFILQGSKDLTHAILTIHPGIAHHTLIQIQNFIPFSGVTGRFLLIGAFFIALLFRDTYTETQDRVKKAVVFSLFSFFIAIFLIVILSLINTPIVFFPNSFITRPYDLIAGILFLILLFIFIKKYLLEKKDHTPFMNSMIITLILSIDTQIFMMHSQELFDPYYFIGHFIKNISYMIPIFGITFGTFSMFVLAEEQKEQLKKAGKVEKHLLEQSARLEMEKVKAEEMKKTLDLKNEFTLIVSHELRTPLTAMKEGVSIVLEEISGKLNDNQREILTMVAQNINRLARLINDVLDYQILTVQTLQYSMRQHNFNGAVLHVVNSMKPLIEKKGLQVKTQLDSSIPPFDFDGDRIIQAVSNLLDNAIKYTDFGTITLSSKKEKNHVLFSIEDTGCGIRDEHREQIFESFFQRLHLESKAPGGTGLGLPITKKIIEQHKGKIWLESTPGKGTTVFFTLPIVQQKEGAYEKESTHRG